MLLLLLLLLSLLLEEVKEEEVLGVEDLDANGHDFDDDCEKCCSMHDSSNRVTIFSSIGSLSSLCDSSRLSIVISSNFRSNCLPIILPINSFTNSIFFL